MLRSFQTSPSTSWTVLLTVLVGLTLSASALAARPLLQIEESPIEGKHTLEHIKGEIMAAGRVRGWRMKEIAPGHLEAIIYVRSHMAKVDIKFTNASYSILYKDSENLKYKDGKIHKAYNSWVNNLDRDIQVELGY